MKCVELFAGAGGLSLGLIRVGIDIVLANEIDPVFSETYSINHRKTKIINGDIHGIDFVSEIAKLGFIPGQIGIVSGGPPCQGFSTVGSKNKKDPRNSLFYEFLRAVSEIQPEYVVFENVSGFKRLYNGEAFQILLEELGYLGYACQHGILDASDFGLPQIRKRTVVIGAKTKTSVNLLPRPTHSIDNDLFGLQKKLNLIEAISDLPAIGSGGESDTYLTEPINDFQFSLRNGLTKLTEHNASNYGLKMQKILALIPPGGCVDDLPKELRPRDYFNNTYARLLPNHPSPTITRNFGTPSSSRCVHPFQNRALSTREGARLQGFPDDYHFSGSKISKNLQIGNSVPPILGELIGKQLVKQ